MPVETTHVSENGRIVIPAVYRKAMGLKGGEVVTIRMDADGLHIQSRRQVLQKVRENMKKFIKPGRSMVDALLDERRADAKRERGR